MNITRSILPRLEQAQKAFLATTTRSASSSGPVAFFQRSAATKNTIPAALLQQPLGSRSFSSLRFLQRKHALLTAPATTNEALRAFDKNQTRSFAAAGLAKKIMTVTPTAAERVTELMRLDTECKGIRISLRQRGCSGMSYVMDFQKDEPKKFDEVLEFVDVAGKQGRVVVDAQAVLFLVGTEMDYMEVEMGSEFVFNNPNEKGTCGCGQSFNV